MAFIEIENLRYRYPSSEHFALDGISLQIEKGSFLGIIGRNGAGKSTLASAIAGLVPQFYKGAYGGRVLVDSLDASRTPVSTLSSKVGLVFQNPFNQLSGAADNVYDEVCFGMQNFAIDRDEMIRRADQVLSLMGMTEYKDRNPFDLSGGQMQRVALSSVLVMEPDVIILDEPTSQLDPQGSEEVFQAVDKLRERGITVIMIEQKIDKIAKYSDHILLLENGKTIGYGTPEELFANYDTARYGVLPPAVVQIADALSFRKSNETLPVLEQDAIPLMSEHIIFTEARHTREEATDAIMRAENLSFHYNEGKDVLSSISLSFDSRPTAIIGQNGAGKTTLAKLLKGLLKPSEGRIFFKDIDTKNRTAASITPDIGYVFQNPDDQIFKPKVLDEVMFGPLNIGMGEAKAKEQAMKALEMVRLENTLERNPYDLDLHERKMVALASVIAMSPSVIIFDEPTIAQDDDGKQMMRDVIAELAKEGKLVISILHDMDLVASSFDRVIAMAHGTVIDDGAPEEVFSHSETLKRAGLEEPHVSSLARKLGSNDTILTVAEFLSLARKV